MDFNKILAISGKSGLFELVAERKNGVVARNLDSTKSSFITNRLYTVTPLAVISIYTDLDSIPLLDVLVSMKVKAENDNLNVPAYNDNNEVLKQYFAKIIPDYDRDRVYVSDMKRIIKWYELLKEKDLIHPAPTEEEAEKETTTPTNEVETADASASTEADNNK